MIKHGYFINGARPPEYDVWKAMRSRCESPRNKDFKHYGGRGITVCDRWQSFSAFMEDMGERPSPAWQIERIDNDQGYAPGNCIWATKAAQARNTRRARTVLHNGKSLSIREYASELDIPYQTAVSRLQRQRASGGAS